jgi:hypothetical protein
VAYFCGNGQHSFWPERDTAAKPPAAVRFALEGETLKAEVLWDGKDFPGAGGFTGMLYYKGRLYTTGREAVIIDAATGKALAKAGGKGSNTANRILPDTRHLLLLAGDRFYGLNGSHRTCDGNFDTFATLGCYSLDGKLLGQSKLTAAPVEGAKLEQVRTQVGWDKWPFGYGLTFTIGGNRIYVRGFDELICIGEK